MAVQVVIIIGSDSDLPKVKESGMLEILNFCGVSWELSIISAHRHDKTLNEYCSDILMGGTQLVIVAAGMSAQLAGAIIGKLGAFIPVLGVGLASFEYPDASDAESAMTRLPAGCALGFTGVNKAGLVNAAILACQIKGLSNEAIMRSLRHYLVLNKKSPQLRVMSSAELEGDGVGGD